MPYKDPEKQKEYQRQWLKAKKNRTKVKTHRDNIKLWLRSIKVKLGCQLCGEKHPSCLVFHHRDPKQKKFGLSESASKFKRAEVIAELEKCDVLCANCHAKIHYKELQWPVLLMA